MSIFGILGRRVRRIQFIIFTLFGSLGVVILVVLLFIINEQRLEFSYSGSVLTLFRYNFTTNY